MTALKMQKKERDAIRIVHNSQRPHTQTDHPAIKKYKIKKEKSHMSTLRLKKLNKSIENFHFIILTFRMLVNIYFQKNNGYKFLKSYYV